jgi:hypothetical protein
MWMLLLEKHLSPPSFSSIYPVYRFMLIRQPDFVALSDEALASSSASRDGWTPGHRDGHV